MDKKTAQTLTDDVLVADAVLRLQAITNLLISKGIISKTEFDEELKSVSSQILKSILQKANISGDLDQLLGDVFKSINKNN